MAVTTTYSWNFLDTIDLDFGIDVDFPDSAPEAISLSGGSLAISGNHTSHTDGDVFNGNLVGGNAWNVGTGTNAALAQLSNGNIVVASQDADSILYEIRTTGGSVVLASTDIGDTGSSNADVAAIAGGGFAIASQDFIGADYDIQLEYYTNAGVAGTFISVTSEVGVDEIGASVSGLTGGNVVVTWTRDDGATTEVWRAIYNSAGAVVAAPAVLDDFDSVNRNISVTALANGGFAVAYEDDGWLTGTVDITVATYTSTGGLVDIANIGSAQDDATPYIAQIANGMLVVAFSRDFGDFDTEVVLLDSSTLAELATDSITAGQSLFDNTINPAIAGFGLGRVGVVHTNVTDSQNQGEFLQAVRTSTGDALNNIITGDDFIDIMNGGAGNDRLNGRGNADDLTGGTGRDRLDGGNGSDVLRGNGSIDTLLGGAGTDFLNGGDGNDSLTGGANQDFFNFTTAFGPTNRDFISDFSVADDTIRIDNAVFVGLAAGALAPTAFRIGAAAADATDRIIYNFATGALYFDPNGVGGAAQIQFATLAPGLALTAADFVVI